MKFDKYDIALKLLLLIILKEISTYRRSIIQLFQEGTLV